MTKVLLFNKPFNVLSQFTDPNGRATLKDYIDEQSFYPAGRLDYDSEGLLALVDDGTLQARISDPKHKLPKTYWVQVEGSLTSEAISQLERGVLLKDGQTKPAKASIITPPEVWPRTPPIRERKSQSTSWLSLTITEGKNRQVRRMTAHVGFPTLRLIRYAIGPWSIKGLSNGEYKFETVHLPKDNSRNRPSQTNKKYAKKPSTLNKRRR